MNAIVITEETYPIIYVHFQGASTVKETKNFLSRFSEWLSRQESFSLILRQTAIENDPISAEEHKEVHRAIAQWAKQHKPQIANYCVGMAMVIDSPKAFEEEQAKIPKMMKGMFGCPGKAFKTIGSAEQWIENLLAKSE